MYDRDLVLGCLEEIEEALSRIDRRFKGIDSATAFEASDEGLDRLDAIAMVLVWIGENVKRLDKLGVGDLLAIHPEVDWRGAKGMRDVLAHDYGRADAEAVYNVCVSDIPAVRKAIAKVKEAVRRDSPM